MMPLEVVSTYISDAHLGTTHLVHYRSQEACRYDECDIVHHQNTMSIGITIHLW